MNKIKYVSIMIAVCLLTACKAEETLNMETADYGLFDYVVTIENQSYLLPVKVSELTSNGWSFAVQKRVAPGASVEAEMMSGRRKLFCTLTNYEPEEVSADACYITGLMVSKENSGEDIAFYQGIKIGASLDDVMDKTKEYFHRRIEGGSEVEEIDLVDDLYYEEGFGYQLFFQNNFIESIKVTYCPSEFDRKKRSDMLIGRDELPVHELTTQVFENIQPDVLYSHDFNRDGKEDTMVVKYEKIERDGVEVPVVLLAVNDRVTLIDENGELMTASLITREDGTCAAIFTFYKVDDYIPCCVYQILDERCMKTCEIRGDLVEGSLTENQCSLVTYENVVGSGWISQTDYEITEGFELKRVGNSKITDRMNRGGLTVKKELPVVFEDGTEGAIEPGIRMNFYETDFKTILTFGTNDGRRGTIPVKTDQRYLEGYEYSLTHISGIELIDYFEEEKIIFWARTEIR